MNLDISFEQCITIIDESIYDYLQMIIDDYIKSPMRDDDLLDGRVTFEEDLKRRETDPKQKTQAVTKLLQYWMADAFAKIIKRYNLPIIGGTGAGNDYQYIGNSYNGEVPQHPIPIEFKAAGGKDGTVACLGNLGVNVKCDMTLICRYQLSGNRITHKQTVVIGDSARKWDAYNKAKFDPATGKSKSSNYSGLKCLGYDLEGNKIDVDDIVCYSGKIDPKQAYINKNGEFVNGWVQFIKEEII
jgi:roadblock/LC7 domain-containing protein